MPVPSIAYQQYFTSNGLPRNGGKVYTYAAGTTTPKATFTTALGDVPAANPVILNSAGIPDHGSGNIGMIWITGAYDFLVTNSDGTDPVWVYSETSFNTIAPAGASFFQTWSGDGTTTTFTLSQSLGTDENAVLLYVDNGLSSFIANGDFATDTIWTKGAGWTIAAGVATATGAISTALSQTATTTLIAGQSYTVTFTVTASAGTVTPSIGGTSGTTRGAGTFTETIIAGATQLIAFTGVGFTGTLDNISVRLVEGIGRQVVYPTEFTLNNTSFTLATAPKAGTNNIAMFSFSTLVAAASASAAAAEAFANAAGVSATAAQGYAAALTSTSTTSLAIGLGSKVFTTQANKQYTTGQFISAVSAADATNYMHGNVVTYTGGTLTLNVTDVGGSGTFADWNISISGTRGATAGASTPITANSVLANTSASAAVPAALAIGASQLVGRGSTGNVDVITLGAGLSMTGTVLSSANAATRLTQSTGQALTSGVLTAIAFDNSIFDDENWHDNVINNSRITVNFTGRIRLTASLGALPASGNDRLHIYKSGVLLWSSAMTSVGGGPPNVYAGHINILDDCTSGNYYEFYVTPGSSYTTNIDYTQFTAERTK